MAVSTSGRTGSIIPVRPTKQRSFSRNSGSFFPGRAGQRRSAAASTRSARSAIALLAARISARFSSVSGTTSPFSRQVVQRSSTTSGAPLVYWMNAPSSACTVDIILRPESNGASSTRGCAACSSFLGRPSAAAKLTSAASVGSPSAWPFSPRLASLHSAMAVASVLVSPIWSTTVILFWVSVPVLSEQMTCVQPSVSTAVSRRMTALRLLMLVTPMDSTTVTTVARPSGMAATASETATMKVERTLSSVKDPAAMRSNTKMNTQMPSTSLDSVRPSSSRRRCRGVCSSCAAASAPAILPISVSMPVPVMTARPRP